MAMAMAMAMAVAVAVAVEKMAVAVEMGVVAITKLKWRTGNFGLGKAFSSHASLVRGWF